MKCKTKCPFNSLKVKTVLGVILLNHTLVGPLSVVGKALHMISSWTPYRCMRVLNNSRWLSGFFDPSYAFTCGIQNLAGRGKEVTYVVKGESVQWTSSSRSVDTRPLMVFIIMSIFSFIICMCYAMRIASISSLDRRLVSCRSRLLAALLSFWSSLSCRPLVGGWLLLRSPLSLSSCWSSGRYSFLLFSCCSNSWLCWVRRLTTAVRVCTCLSNVLKGFPVS